MSGQAIALVTKGILCKGGERIIKRFIPLNLQLQTDIFKLSLKKQDPIKLNLSIIESKITLKNFQHQLNLKVIDKYKLNLKVCED